MKLGKTTLALVFLMAGLEEGGRHMFHEDRIQEQIVEATSHYNSPVSVNISDLVTKREKERKTGAGLALAGLVLAGVTLKKLSPSS